jgi:uncharacterized protein YacL
MNLTCWFWKDMRNIYYVLSHFLEYISIAGIIAVLVWLVFGLVFIAICIVDYREFGLRMFYVYILSVIILIVGLLWDRWIE